MDLLSNTGNYMPYLIIACNEMNIYICIYIYKWITLLYLKHYRSTILQSQKEERKKPKFKNPESSSDSEKITEDPLLTTALPIKTNIFWVVCWRWIKYTEPEREKQWERFPLNLLNLQGKHYFTLILQMLGPHGQQIVKVGFHFTGTESSFLMTGYKRMRWIMNTVRS